jgi:hypothetical protein
MGIGYWMAKNQKHKYSDSTLVLIRNHQNTFKERELSVKSIKEVNIYPAALFDIIITYVFSHRDGNVYIPLINYEHIENIKEIKDAKNRPSGNVICYEATLYGKPIFIERARLIVTSSVPRKIEDDLNVLNDTQHSNLLPVIGISYWNDEDRYTYIDIIHNQINLKKLSHFIEDQTISNWRRIKIVCQIFSGIEYLVSKEIFIEIWSENIFVDDDDNIFISDYHFKNLHYETYAASANMADYRKDKNIIKGIRNRIERTSPEDLRLLKGDEHDRSRLVFKLGLLLYEIFLGKIYTGMTEEECRDFIKNGGNRTVTLSQIQKSPAIVTSIAECLYIEPEKRITLDSLYACFRDARRAFISSDEVELELGCYNSKKNKNGLKIRLDVIRSITLYNSCTNVNILINLYRFFTENIISGCEMYFNWMIYGKKNLILWSIERFSDNELLVGHLMRFLSKMVSFVVSAFRRNSINPYYSVILNLINDFTNVEIYRSFTVFLSYTTIDRENADIFKNHPKRHLIFSKSLIYPDEVCGLLCGILNHYPEYADIIRKEVDVESISRLYPKCTYNIRLFLNMIGKLPTQAVLSTSSRFQLK